MSEPEIAYDKHADLRRCVQRMNILLATPHDASETWLREHDKNLFEIADIANKVKTLRSKQGKSYAS